MTLVYFTYKLIFIFSIIGLEFDVQCSRCPSFVVTTACVENLFTICMDVFILGSTLESLNKWISV